MRYHTTPGLAPAGPRALRRALLGGCAVLAAPIAAVAVLAAPVAAAADDAGVPYGAPRAEFVAALEDMDPIRLKLASSFSSISPGARSDKEFATYLSEYSGGKIEVEIMWSSSAASLFDAHEKIAAGFVDAGGFGPYYHPNEFPIGGVLAGALTAPVMGGSPVRGFLISQAVSIELGYAVPAYYQEISAHESLVPLVPGMLSYPNTLLCKGEKGTTMAELTGRQIGVTTTAQANELDELGAIPVSSPITEIYQAIDRGVMDCMAGSVGLMGAIGVMEVADYWTFDPHASFSSVPTAYVFSRYTWDSLPLAARQVVFDAYVQRIRHAAEVSWALWDEQLTEARDNGVEVVAFTEEVSSRLREIQAANIDKLAAGEGAGARVEDPAGIVATSREVIAKWESRISELGYSDDVAWSEFPQWYADGAADLTAWHEAVAREVMLPHRP